MNIFDRAADIGWKGIDADLETSMMEYGLVMKKSVRYPGEYHVLYAIGYREVDRQPVPNLFGHSFYSMKELREVIRESWFNRKGFFSFIGMSPREWLRSGHLPSMVHDLVQYHGAENILGSDYYPKTLKQALRFMTRTDT